MTARADESGTPAGRPEAPAAPLGSAALAEDNFLADPERRRRMEDLARQLTSDRPPRHVLERLRTILRLGHGH